MEMGLMAVLMVTLLVVIWIAGVLLGYRLGRRVGLSEGYGMCLRDRRTTKVNAFGSLYGRPVPRQES